MKEIKYFRVCKWLMVPILLLGSSQPYADDIEVYVPGGGGDSKVKHNIMFLLDTSGSMHSTVAAIADNSVSGYDPNQTYGDGSSDGRVYIYDDNLNYTGNSFLASQSVCEGMNLLHGSNSSYPVYRDKIAQWQQTSFEREVPGDCDTNSSSSPTQQNIYFSNTYYGLEDEWRGIIIPLPEAGGSFDITIDGSRKLKRSYFRTYNISEGYYQSRSGVFCDKSPLNNNKINNCKGNANANHDTLIAWVRFNTDKGTTVTISGTVTGLEVPVVCPPVTENIATNNWKNVLIDSDSPAAIIECSSDAGEHGINNSSNYRYASSCPNNNVCSSPRYSTSYNQRYNFIRTTENYVPANFHDFLQGGGEPIDISSLPRQNASSYCGWSGLDGVRFVDTNTETIFECKEKLGMMKSAINNMLDGMGQNAPINIGLTRFLNSGGLLLNPIDDIKTNKQNFLNQLNSLTFTGNNPTLQTWFGTPLQGALWETKLYYGSETPSYSTNSSYLNSGNYKSPITDSCQSNNVILLTDGVPSSGGERRSLIESFSGKTCTSNAGDCLDELAHKMARHDFVPITQTPNGEIGEGVNSVNTYTIGFNIDFPLLEDTAEAGKGEHFTASDTSELQIAFNTIIDEILTTAATIVAPAVSVNAFNELQHRDELYYAVFRPSSTTQWPGNMKKYKIAQGQIIDSNSIPAVDNSGFFSDNSQSYWSDIEDGPNVTIGGASGELTNARDIYADVNGTVRKLTSLDTVFANNLARKANSQPLDILSWILGQDPDDKDGDGDATDASQFLADPLHNQPRVITYGGQSSNPIDVLFFTTNLGMLTAVDPKDTSGRELWSYWPEEHHDNAESFYYPDDATILGREYGLDGQSTYTFTEASDSTSRNFNLTSVQTYFGERRGGSRFYGLDVSNARSDLGAQGKLDASYDTPFKVLWKINGSMPDGSNSAKAGVTSCDVSAQHKVYGDTNLADAGFEDMGQSWSAMIPTTIKTENGSEDVLVFAGGYDPIHDIHCYNPESVVYDTENISADNPPKTEFGNAIYVISRERVDQNGKPLVLFSVGNNDDSREDTEHVIHADMMHSIAATPTVVDSDGDGDFDIIYAIDMVGNVWRVDYNQSEAPYDSISINDDFGTAGKIASLSDVSENRKFYNSIDISISDSKSGDSFYNLIVGSGYRASPRLTRNTNDRLYVLFDDYLQRRNLTNDNEPDRYNYFQYNTTDSTQDLFRTVTHQDIVNSSIDSPASKFTYRLDSSGNELPYTINGFYVEFDSGEKVLQSTTTFNGRVLFSTFLPQGQAANVCGGGSIGSGRVYLLSLDNGTSVLDRVPEEPPEDSDPDVIVQPVDKADPYRFIELDRGGIPVTPSLLFTKDGLVACIGTECDITTLDDQDLEDFFGYVPGRAYKSYWREQ